MGLLSDHDVNEIDAIVSREIEKLNENSRLIPIDKKEMERIRIQFLEGYERAWRPFKEGGKFLIGVYLVDIHTKAFELGRDMGLRIRPKDFGAGLGFIAGSLTYSPKLAFEHPFNYATPINALKSKPENVAFYEYAIGKVKKWNETISKSEDPEIRELMQKQQGAYNVMLRILS